MAKNIYCKLKYDSDGTNSFTVDPNDSRILDVDLWKCENVQFVFKLTYAATHASTTGARIVSYAGIGPKDTAEPTLMSLPCVLDGVSNPDIWFGDNGVNISFGSVTFPTGSSNVIKYIWMTDDFLRTRVSRWQRFEIFNDDLTNDLEVSIIADM